MSTLARVSTQLFNTPLMLRPEKAEMLCAALVDRLGIQSFQGEGRSVGADDLRAQAADYAPSHRPGAGDMYSVHRRVARISIDGTLVHKLGGVRPVSGMVGYDCLDQIISHARENKAVGSILLDIDSPGGTVAGCFELARKIAAGNGRAGGKPIIAFANETTCSAAYAIASACDAVMTTGTGVVGSIGVWVMIVDMTAALDKGGMDVRMIRAGDRKARGGPYEKPDDPTIAKLQGSVDETWSIFADHVSRSRPIDRKAVLALEGDWFGAREAQRHGLVDVIDTPDAIFDAAARLAAA
jgi:capsid assembly protease